MEDIKHRLGLFEGGMRAFQQELALIKASASDSNSTGQSTDAPNPFLERVEKLEANFTRFTDSYFDFTASILNHVVELDNKMDGIEQYSRRNCLLLHRVPESVDEDCRKVAINFFKDNLNHDVSLSEIDRAHRLNRRKPSAGGKQSPRPLIVKFVSYASRSYIFSIKKRLKGSSFSITESLTPTRLDRKSVV